jgi:ABC-type transport system involved in multi-copper enzyme maturation permease subunit
MFNMLVGPVFSAGTVTSERERQTLDLLLTTIITPWQILWGKLVAGLRVSTVLTLFLVWPVVLAAAMVNVYWGMNLAAIVTYLAIVLLTCVVTAMIALFCSVVFHKTATSMIASYMIIVVLFCGPLAAEFFAKNFFPTTDAALYIDLAGAASPFAAAFDVPLAVDLGGDLTQRAPTGDWRKVAGYFGFTLALVALLFGAILWFFEARWRVAEGGEGDDE